MLSADSYVAHRPKGTVRRARLQEAREATGFAPHKLGKEALSDSDRAAWSSVHPSMMGGEYLPDLEPAVVEIARIEMASTTGDVISLRAAPEPSGAISYQLVDEYEQELSFSPTTTPLPLTFGEIADLLDKATIAEDEFEVIWGPLTANAYEGGDGPRGVKGFIRVVSPFYPDLEPYFDWRVRQWIAEQLRSLRSS